MGAKQSKVKKGEKKGVAGEDDSPDSVDRTATLPASFRHKEEAATKTETLPRNLNRSTSFTNSCRNWAKKKGLVKDKSPNKTEVEKEIEPKENGTMENKDITITPSAENSKAVTKLAQKKARAQFFEDMYNSSGLSVTSSLTPEKPKRLCDMNLPSPRIGPGSPVIDKVEGKVELLAKQIEEKEKLNKSLESDTTSLDRSLDDEMVVKEVMEEKPTVSKDHEEVEKKSREILENILIEETIGEISTISITNEEVREELIEVTRTETLEEKEEIVKEEVKGVLEVKSMLDASNDQDALDETLPSTARLEPTAATQHIEDDHNEEEEMKTKDQVVDVGEIKDVNEIEAAAVEPSSLESVNTDDEDAKVVENGGEEVEDTMENVINNGGDSSEEGGASTDEGYDEEKKGGGAEGVKKMLKNKSEVDEYEESASVENN